MASVTNKELYDRRWKIEVTDPKTSTTKTWGRYGDNLEGSDLRIQFSTQEGESSKHESELTLIITNLNKKNQQFLSQRGLEVTLQAGYKELFGLVFKGKTTDQGYTNKEKSGSSLQIMNKKDDTDWSTQLNVMDTFPNKKKTIISIGFNADTTLQTVLNKIAKELGVADGKIKLPKDLKKVKFNNGVSLYGNAPKIINDLIRPYGLIYSLKNKALNIYSPTAGINDEVFIINSDTGLIDSPDKTDKGWAFRTLLYPNLFKGQYIKLDGITIKKELIIEKIRYRGDSSGNEWYTEIEGIEKK